MGWILESHRWLQVQPGRILHLSCCARGKITARAQSQASGTWSGWGWPFLWWPEEIGNTTFRWNRLWHPFAVVRRAVLLTQPLSPTTVKWSRPSRSTSLPSHQSPHFHRPGETGGGQCAGGLGKIHMLQKREYKGPNDKGPASSKVLKGHSSGTGVGIVPLSTS